MAKNEDDSANLLSIAQDLTRIANALELILIELRHPSASQG